MVDELQFAEIDVHAALVPAVDVGAAGVAGNVAYVMVDELALVPQLFVALTL